MDLEPRRLTRRRRKHWAVEPDPELEAQLDDEAGVYEVVNRRRILWRDSAFILIGVIVALLVAQFVLPRSTARVAAEESAIPSGMAIGSVGPPRTLAPGETFGPIVDESLGIDATPTPIPEITLGPTRKPKPSATPTAEPTASSSPTPRITPKPTRTPRPPTPSPPSQPPPPTPTPPNADFTWTQTISLTIAFTDTSTDATTWSWAFGDGETSMERNPTHLYVAGPNTYPVTLTVTGPGGSDPITIQIDVTL